MHHRLLLASAISAMLCAAPAAAQSDGPAGFARVGVTRVRLADQGPIFINGTRDPAADYKTPTRYVASGTLGYFVQRQIALELSATTPTSTSNTPAGSLAGIPSLGSDRFSIFTATVTFHPLRGGVISPYVGGGGAFQHVWSTRDGAASNLHIDDAFGPVVQGGVELSVGRGFGLFAEAKKAFYSAQASADLGPAHVTADAKLDPFLLQAGALIRF